MQTPKQVEDAIKKLHNLIIKPNEEILSLIKDLPEEEASELFFKDVYSRFKIGQKLILKYLIKIEKEKSQINDSIKKEKNREKKAKLKEQISLLKYREQVYRKLADSIAWHIMGAEHYVARRLFSGDEYPSLLSKGLESVTYFVDNYNKKPLSFALISDITSFVQIGDVLCVDAVTKSRIYLEIKTGEVNKKVLDLLERFNGDLEAISKTEGVTEEMLKQAERVLKQHTKGQLKIDLINNKGGFDDTKNTRYSVSESEDSLVPYTELILNAVEKSTKEGYGYEVVHYGFVGPILHIGAYKGNWQSKGKQTLSFIALEGGENTIIFNYRQTLFHKLAPPIFIRFLPRDLVIDLITGRVDIYIALNVDKLIELFNFFEVKARWLSTKETHKIKDTKGVFIFKNRAIGVKIGEIESILGDGIISRIFNDSIDPLSIVATYIKTSQVEIQEEEE